jgi:hypothetical protein
MLVFLVGISALIISIIGSIDNRIQRAEMRKIQKELSEAISGLNTIKKEDDKILKEVKKDEGLDRDMIDKILRGRV